MSDAFDRFERVVHWLGQAALLAATGLVVYIMVTQMIEVVVRAAGHPTTWVYDFNLAAIVGTVFLGIAGAERAGDNINVDFFTERLSARANRILAVINALLALLFLAILIWFGIAVVLESIHHGRTLGSLAHLPSALPEASLPIGAGIMALQVVVGLVRLFHPAAGQAPVDIVEIGGPGEPVEVPLKPTDPEP
jgi:C4-dicarboxylate transporter, DctQ subunit